MITVRISRKMVAAAAVLGGSLILWAGCALMPKKEPIPPELAILFTASTGGELEPCG